MWEEPGPERDETREILRDGETSTVPVSVLYPVFTPKKTKTPCSFSVEPYASVGRTTRLLPTLSPLWVLNLYG